ncbi:MAG: hypothetical protein ACIPMY_03370, partial [Rickettsia endosymbiont of Pentastiridius leporinus]
MSKESLKPSINTSKEGARNAEESNKLNPESVQEQTLGEQKEAGRRVLKDDAKLKGTRMARAGAAAAAVAGATVEAGIHVGTGIAKGVAGGNDRVGRHQSAFPPKNRTSELPRIRLK